MTGVQVASRGRKALPVKLCARGVTFSQRFQSFTQTRLGDRFLDGDGRSSHMNCYWDCKPTSSEAAHKNPPTPRSQSIFPISTLAAPHPPPFSRKAFGAPASQWESPLGAIYGFPVAGQSLHSHGSSRQPLLLVRHVYSCIPAAAAVLFSQLPAPSPLHKEEAATTTAHFFPFFFLLYTNIYRVLYTSLHRQCHSEYTAFCRQSPGSCGDSPGHDCTYSLEHPSPPAGLGTRVVGGCKNREAELPSSLPQPGSRPGAHMLISFLAHPWRGQVTLTVLLCTHMCSSPSGALGARVACPPHASKTHVSSLPSPFRPRIPIERCTRKSAMSSLEQPLTCSVSGSPSLMGDKGEKSHGM